MCDQEPIFEYYEDDPEEQEGAFQEIEEFLEEEDVHIPIKEVETSVRCHSLATIEGPKRLEVCAIRNANEQKVHVVVTSIIPPQGRFTSRTLNSREWLYDYGKGPCTIGSAGSRDQISRLSGINTVLWEDRVTIKWVKALLGERHDHAYEVDYYEATADDQAKAWASIDRQWGKFEPYEKRDVGEWDWPKQIPAKTGTASPGRQSGTTYHHPAARSSHWTNRMPGQSANSKTTFFRVCGDEVGATLYRQQANTFTKKAPTLDELVLLLADGIAEEGEGESTGGSEAQSTFCDCGSAYCEVCGEEYWSHFSG